MFKKIAITASLAALALSSSVTFAAGDARHTITLKASVPTNGFHVVPVDSDLVNKDQDMSYNPLTGTMKTVNGHFDVRNTNGSVHAYLEGIPTLIGGSSLIPLEIKFNNIVLNQTPQLVVGESESNVNYRAPITITAKGTTFTPGDYTGAVPLIFDAVLPVDAVSSL
ncbi:CS1 type fimbrial major subunit [Pseudomonas sp. COW5]|uniref:CS1 type fimbrial major subunit n=1 Tax=Pseudomonas sp. COW5 TaxID=2981253 RepID=UPI0022484186|nr:CS1 type fimbrial major subunit [Pseudomonas sp. COW5]MCX2544561.1 fimbrial protein [Pseudomonas sp. COW5]